ncbi:MAG TPA: amino acid permease [Gemmatimonadales bacterium]|nr:amino acid permease [Gemmatimonadales bacterium]
MSQPVSYARRIGLFSGVMMVIGGIIGAGIFRNPAEVAHRVVTTEFTLLAWVIGGVIALIGAFCYGELGARNPQAGGGYVYLRDAFGELPAFLYAWTLLLVIATGAIAGVAVTFANYTVALFGLSTSTTVPLAIGAILLLSAVNYLGVKPGAITQNIFTVLKLVPLAILIIAGIFLSHHAAIPAPAAAEPLAVPSGAVGIVVAIGWALVPILFSYGGWQQTNFIGEEIIDAPRNLPRAILLGVLAVVTIYLLANVAYIRALGITGLAASTAPAADAMTRTLGPTGGTIIAAGIAISTFGFLNLVILVSPRVYQAMAADGLFFPRMARLHPRYRTPTAAILFQAGWAIVLTLTGKYGDLVDYVVFGDWIFFGLTAATLYVFRARDVQAGIDPAPPGSFRTLGYPVTPALFCLAAAYVVLSSVRSNPTNTLKGAALIGLGIPVFLFWRSRRQTA